MNCTSKNPVQNNFYCDVCKISIQTEAENALHEFSKKHCDNLLRIAKNKPIISKHKSSKSESLPAKKDSPKVNVVTNQGNFAKYGYFVPGEHYDKASESREFNTEYDPYLQKYSAKESNALSPVVKPMLAESVSFPAAGVTGFKRKKKKKIRSCEICNVMLLTVPEYEAHMRSPQHSWKLKMSGMGVSAHFVKASSDLHTIETNEDSASYKSSEPDDPKNVTFSENSSSSAPLEIFPTLYCDTCELLLNSEQQFNIHVNGKSHNENVQRKAEMKAKKLQLENPNPNQLYCYSCRVALNNLYQYNEHKFGKKHKMKCRRLMREGITIPPEERVATWGLPSLEPNKPVIYPEMYQKCVIETQKRAPFTRTGNELKNHEGDEVSSAVKSGNSDLENTEKYYCKICNVSFKCPRDYELHSDIAHGGCHQIFPSHTDIWLRNGKSGDDRSSIESTYIRGEKESSDGDEARSKNLADTPVPCNAPRIISYSDQNGDAAKLETLHGSGERNESVVAKSNDVAVGETKPSEVGEPSEPDAGSGDVILFDAVLNCTVCRESFAEQSRFELHLSGEEHARKIRDLKEGGASDDEILQTLLRDQTVVKPDRLGRFTCGICRVTTRNSTEFQQHVASVVHKKSEQDYRKKKKIEIGFAAIPDGYGKYACKLCQEKYETLVQFNQHLHAVGHVSCAKAEKARKITAKKRSVILQQQQRRVKQKYIISGLKRKNFAFWRRKCEKNPGVRTKIAGMATDLNTGAKSSVPNLEPLESKIDSARNVTIGAGDVTTETQNVCEKYGKTTNRRGREKWKANLPKRRNSRPVANDSGHSVIKPLLNLPLNNPRLFAAQPLPQPQQRPISGMGMQRVRPLLPDFKRGGVRNWTPPYPQNYHFRGTVVGGGGGGGVPHLPFFGSRYQRSPNFHPQWPRYPPCFR